MIEMAGTIAAAPSIDLAADLLECLSHLEPADSTKAFALFETQHNPPNPGICLRNGGSIGLPLSDGDAQVFRAASYPASLERDPAVYTWIIPAGEFEIQNPAWGPFLQGVVTKVSAGLGVDSTGKGVSAELFSLSLHDAGSRSTPVRR
jgi:hypothetical protein